MTNLSNSETNNNDDFAVGDIVVINSPLEFINSTFDSDALFIVQDVCGQISKGITILINGDRVVVADTEIRHATAAEKIAKRRLPAPVAFFISKQVEWCQPYSPEKLAILDMGLVSDIGNHISPLCKVQNYGPENPSFNDVLNKSYMTDVINHLVRAHKAQREVT